MSESRRAGVGTIGWADLTVLDAAALKQFYHEVVGWEPAELEMGGYNDYCMNSAEGEAVAGICYARGHNAGLPPQWLVYITVENLEHSIHRCTEFGGRVIAGPRSFGPQGRSCVIQDPAGAVAALWEPAR